MKGTPSRRDGSHSYTIPFRSLSVVNTMNHRLPSDGTGDARPGANGDSAGAGGRGHGVRGASEIAATGDRRCPARERRGLVPFQLVRLALCSRTSDHGGGSRDQERPRSPSRLPKSFVKSRVSQESRSSRLTEPRGRANQRHLSGSLWVLGLRTPKERPYRPERLECN